ncbi:PRC-barrel domain-containing protein [Natronolimnohabitans innermongolicus]|uniref:PRC-barrel domain-containing protein n=1 Tax=Natronolimnohabitans innermongolicus JCM 12255 TaxID=1227499 RepID=L9WIV4_9EURY|nr:PRC-barrel domain-containing protein [Natronolimnohabitans innermongolicus]ELY49312.1 PRC-barrel domain-containing protein [Natronolimnohabitans innermongolicus JCM 12255]
MPDVFAKTLTRKTVVSADGVEFGRVRDVTLSPDSGELHDLIVEPTKRYRSRSIDFETDENDRFLVPIERVRIVKDAIVVQY